MVGIRAVSMDVREDRLGVRRTTGGRPGRPVQGTLEIRIRGDVCLLAGEQLIGVRVGRAAQVQACQQALRVHEACLRSPFAPQDRILPTDRDRDPFQVGMGETKLCRRNVEPGEARQQTERLARPVGGGKPVDATQRRRGTQDQDGPFPPPGPPSVHRSHASLFWLVARCCGSLVRHGQDAFFRGSRPEVRLHYSCLFSRLDPAQWASTSNNRKHRALKACQEHII